ncbi:MAG: M14 family metallopeptidase [Gemmatimonas sp.]
MTNKLRIGLAVAFHIVLVALATVFFANRADAQFAGALEGLGTPPNPKVQVSWDRWFDHATLNEIGRRLAAAHPNRVRWTSMGKSTEGREMMVLTVSDFTKGNADKKPAYYVDGNIHSNEIQGAEFALYIAWWMAEMSGRNPRVDSLLAERTFYVVPTINPDARDHFLKKPNNANTPRTGLSPRDNDGDGVIDEDGMDDLDGDGHITQMRRRNPLGRYISHPDYPSVMIPAPPGQKGEWELLGQEGIDNDGDGSVNEDGPGSYDPNRNWPWRWAAQNVQGGADPYPTSLIETRNVMSFIISHPNIASAQSFHNNGGMILRGPGVPQDEYRPSDVQVFDQLGRTGERILPGYKYMIVWKDLYTVWGGELDWIYGARGVITFSNELFTDFKYFEKEPENGRFANTSAEFNELLLMGEATVPWKKFTHPQYGEIEIGGTKKNFGRVEPGFLIQAEAHRNMAFAFYHANQMPLVNVDSVWSKSLGNGLTEVNAIITNKRLIPTHTQQDVENRISPPDFVSIAGGTAVAGFVVNNPLLNQATEQKLEPGKIRLANIPGNGIVQVRWIVQGGANYTVTVESQKGGTSSKQGR